MDPEYQTLYTDTDFLFEGLIFAYPPHRIKEMQTEEDCIITLNCNSKPKDNLCQVLMKLAQQFLRRRFLKFVNVFSQFCNYPPLEKGGGPSFDQT